MTDYSKPETVSLNDLKTRIKSTDLIPSRVALLGDIDGKFERISQKGIRSLMNLQKSIKNPKHLEKFSRETGIDLQYLVLLRREIEGYTPQPFEIKDIDWVDQDTINKLAGNGIIDSELLFSKLGEMNLRTRFAEKVGIELETIGYLINLASLCKVQWVSLTVGQMLIEAGYANSQQLAAADKYELFEAMDKVNKNGKYYKSTIGLRDIQRLIEAAKYIS
jgi:Domain of unknown function (DUF4332)